MRAWRIFYGDGASFGSNEGPAVDAPSLNVQAIAEDAGITVGRRIHCGHDYYWFEGDRWYGGDIFGLFDFLQRSGVAKFGRSIDRDRFEAIVNTAINDPHLPEKTAFEPGEYRPK